MPETDPASAEELMDKVRDRFWELAMKATVPVAALAAGTLVAHELRVSKIEETRFTNLDGANMRLELTEEFRKEMKEQVGEIKSLIRGIDQRLQSRGRKGAD